MGSSSGAHKGAKVSGGKRTLYSGVDRKLNLGICKSW